MLRAGAFNATYDVSCILISLNSLQRRFYRNPSELSQWRGKMARTERTGTTYECRLNSAQPYSPT